MKFKIGDKVKMVRNNEVFHADVHHIGDKGMVVSIEEKTTFPYHVRFSDGENELMTEKQLEFDTRKQKSNKGWKNPHGEYGRFVSKKKLKNITISFETDNPMRAVEIVSEALLSESIQSKNFMVSMEMEVDKN